MLNPFKNKVAVVTGATSGIGKALCLLLAKKGATVIVTGRNLSKAKNVAAEINKKGGKAFYDILNVRKEKDFSQVIKKVIKNFKRIDYFFNNAGILLFGEMYDTKIKDWREIMDTNLWGCINGTLSVYPIMKKQGFGHIVNTASLEGVMPIPLSTAYSASKHAVVGMTESLRIEAAKFGVKVSVVCPGYINTNIYKSARVLGYKQDQVIPRGFRLMSPERCARIMLREIRKNKRIIIPANAKEKMFYWLYHEFPGIYELVVRKMLGKYRAFKIKKN